MHTEHHVTGSSWGMSWRRRGWSLWLLLGLLGGWQSCQEAPPICLRTLLQVSILSLCLLATRASVVAALDEWPIVTVVTFDLPLDGEFGHVFLNDINHTVDIIGNTNNGFTEQPFLLQNTATVTSLSCPHGLASAQSLNRWGEIAGTCFTAGTRQGFIFRPSNSRQPFTFLAVPAMSATYAYGLNDWGHVVGIYYDAQGGGPHGYWFGGGRYLPLDATALGAHFTSLYAVNNLGGMVGSYVDGEFKDHGLLYWFGQVQQFDVPGARQTLIFDINDQWQMVGLCTLETGDFFSFLYDPTTGQFFRLAVPSPEVFFTDVSGINNQGQIVGRVLIPDPNNPERNISRGFLARLGPRPTPQVATAQRIVQAQRSSRATPALHLVLDGCAPEEAGTVVPAKLARVGCTH